MPSERVGFELLETTLAEAISEWETTEGGPSNGGPTLAHYLATTLRHGSVQQRMEAMGMRPLVSESAAVRAVVYGGEVWVPDG